MDGLGISGALTVQACPLQAAVSTIFPKNISRKTQWRVETLRLYLIHSRNVQVKKTKDLTAFSGLHL
jgi:hypothetical protein